MERWIHHELGKLYPELAKNYWQGHQSYKTAINLIRKSEAGLIIAPKIEVVRVQNQRLIPKQWETNPNKLIRARRAGYDSMNKLLVQ